MCCRLGAVFAIFAGFYYWFAKMCGQPVISERPGQAAFLDHVCRRERDVLPACTLLGLAGMPRRFPDYPDAYSGWNEVSSYGSYLSAVGILLFIFIVVQALTSGRKVEGNYWGEGATTLEWTVPSPAPHHTHEELPIIKPEAAH